MTSNSIPKNNNQRDKVEEEKEKKVERRLFVKNTNDIDNDDEDETNHVTDHRNEDDVWDEIAWNPHEHSLKQGQEQGFLVGSQEGYQNGQALGQHKAMEFGLEIGFIRGIWNYYYHLNYDDDNEDDSSSSSRFPTKRLEKSWIDLGKALDEFPTPEELFVVHGTTWNDTPTNTTMTEMEMNDNNNNNYDNENIPSDSSTSPPDVMAKLLQIRARFKLFMVQLGRADISLKQVLSSALPLPASATATATTTNHQVMETKRVKGTNPNVPDLEW